MCLARSARSEREASGVKNIGYRRLMANRVGVNLRLEEIEILIDILRWGELEEGDERNRLKERIVAAEYFREVVSKVQGWRELLRKKKAGELIDD